MKIKKVNQYICDFCGKKKYSAAAMKQHEKHCTLNPNRKCRMCILIKGVSNNNIPELAKRIPKVKLTDEMLISNYKEINAEFNEIREDVDNCPACLLAIIRQSKTSCSIDFNFKKESNDFLKDMEI